MAEKTITRRQLIYAIHHLWIIECKGNLAGVSYQSFLKRLDILLGFQDE